MRLLAFAVHRRRHPGRAERVQFIDNCVGSRVDHQPGSRTERKPLYCIVRTSRTVKRAGFLGITASLRGEIRAESGDCLNRHVDRVGAAAFFDGTTSVSHLASPGFFR